jgi:hypothetical protein
LGFSLNLRGKKSDLFDKVVSKGAKKGGITMKVIVPPIKSQGIKTKLVPWIKENPS